MNKCKNCTNSVNGWCRIDREIEDFNFATGETFEYWEDKLENGKDCIHYTETIWCKIKNYFSMK